MKDQSKDANDFYDSELLVWLGVDDLTPPDTCHGIADLMEERLRDAGCGYEFGDTDDVASEYVSVFGADRLVEAYKTADAADQMSSPFNP